MDGQYPALPRFRKLALLLIVPEHDEWHAILFTNVIQSKLGDLANSLFVQRQLEGLFSYRTSAVDRLLANNGA